MKKAHLLIALIIWTTVLTLSFVWNYYSIKENNEKIILNKSQAFFEQIVITRSWNSEHGGVYVPITEDTKPNPYLKDLERDIVAVNGKKYTKINPAFMTRQVAELNKSKYGLRFHITSMNPIRPLNKPDEWEAKSLRSFEKGKKEILELVNVDSVKLYRYMAPLVTEESCMKCHAFQGYKVGEVRGGISVTYPAKSNLDIVNHQLLTVAFIHLMIFLVGGIGILIYSRMANRYTNMIEEKNTELSISNASKDKLFSIIAHDLRNPFNSIIGFLDILKSRYDKIDDNERKEYIKEIDDSANQTLNLVNNLLIWARTQQDRIKLIIKNENLYDLVYEAIGAHIHGAKIKGVEILINIPKELTVFVDYYSIQTVVANLLSNAIKFSSNGGLIEISAVKKKNYVEVTIADTGVGIPEDSLRQLFQITKEHTTKGTANEKGSGLGLLICKEFIDKNSGKIHIESELGKGTKVVFTLPNNINP